MTAPTPTHTMTGDRLLRDALVPAGLLRGLAGRDAGEGLVRLDLAIRDGRIASAPGPRAVAEDLGGRIVLPGHVDAHVHLDKTYTARRAGVSRTGLAEAVALAMADAPNRTPTDLAARMDRAIHAALRSGTVAMRSHIDSMTLPSQSAAWDVLGAMQRRWQGLMRIEPVALMRIDRALEPGFAERCAEIGARGGLAGGYIPAGGCDPAAVDAFLEHAGRAGIAVDFHVDESLDPEARGVEGVLDSLSRTGFAGPVTLGHCCALAAMPEARAQALIARMARAGVRVVSLPLTNLYLQDRRPGTTPRLRGLTLVQELAAAGVPVAFASDNVQDPFYPLGAYDLHEVMRQAMLAAQMEADPAQAVHAITRTPAALMGLDEAGVVAPGAPADLIVFAAGDWTGLLSRAHEDRRVIRGGHPLDRLALPAPLTEGNTP